MNDPDVNVRGHFRRVLTHTWLTLSVSAILATIVSIVDRGGVADLQQMGNHCDYGLGFGAFLGGLSFVVGCLNLVLHRYLASYSPSRSHGLATCYALAAAAVLFYLILGSVFSAEGRGLIRFFAITFGIAAAASFPFHVAEVGSWMTVGISITGLVFVILTIIMWL